MDSDAFSGPLAEGFNIVILLSQLAERVPASRDSLLSPASFDAVSAARALCVCDCTPLSRARACVWQEDVAALQFFLANICRVEIARDDELHRVLFPRPVLANFFTEKTKEETLWNLPRDSPGEKVRACTGVCARHCVFCDSGFVFCLRMALRGRS